LKTTVTIGAMMKIESKAVDTRISIRENLSSERNEVNLDCK